MRTTGASADGAARPAPNIQHPAPETADWARESDSAVGEATPRLPPGSEDEAVALEQQRQKMKVLDTLADEVVSSARARCLDPKDIDPSVIEAICKKMRDKLRV